jgi:PAS domain S-box-containing protein
MKILVGYKSRFVVKTLLPTLLTISLFITSFFIVLIPQFEEIVYGRKREMIRELTNSAWNILENWHHKENIGLLTQQQAQESAIRQIEQLRYGEEKKDYFWITDHVPIMIMHPYRPDLNRKSLSDFKDSYGKRLFVEMVTTVENSREGFVDYTWQWKDDSTRIVPKLSFVKDFTPWKWIIGTGMYIEDVKVEIASLEKQITTISIGITIAIAFLLLFIAFQNFRAENQRQQAEQELHESREKYRALVETSTEGLIMVMDDREIFCNKTLYAMLGYPEGFSSGLSFQNLFPAIPKADTFDFEQFKPAAGKVSKIEQVETKIRTRSGDLLDIFISISPINLLNKEGIVLSIKDISRNKEIEDALDNSWRYYYTLMNKLSIGIFRIAPMKEGRFLDVNQAAEIMLGTADRENIFSCTLIELFEDAHEGKKFFDTLEEQGIVRNWITRIRRFSGIKAVISISAVLIRDKQGRTLTCSGMLVDMTEQKRIEREQENLISDLRISISLLEQSIKPFIESYPKCEMHSTVTHAIQLMNQHQCDAVLVTASDSADIGIVTERDIRKRALMNPKGIETPLHSIMTSPLVCTSSISSVFDMLQLFIEKNVSHVVITGVDGKSIGVVHSRNIQNAFHTTYLFFLQKIESLGTIREIKEYQTRFKYLLHLMIENRSSVTDITRMTTLISQSITKRIVTLAVTDLGPPPAEFAFIGLGSDGRKEQTLLTDQDNAIVYYDPVPEMKKAAESYFLRLGELVCSGLDAVGYQYCKGGIMAKNLKWCQPLSTWKDYFTEWVTTANPKNILDLKIFFDFRLLYGSEEILNSLQSHVKKILTGNDPFFLYLSESVLRWELPEGVHKLKTTFDIKKVIMPIVDTARLQALKRHITVTNTLERLTFLYEANVYSKKLYHEIVELYSFLMNKRFQHQAQLISKNITPNNDIEPEECSESDLLIFKKGVTQIEMLKEKISIDFKGITKI